MSSDSLSDSSLLRTIPHSFQVSSSWLLLVNRVQRLFGRVWILLGLRLGLQLAHRLPVVVVVVIVVVVVVIGRRRIFVHLVLVARLVLLRLLFPLGLLVVG